MNRPAGYLIRRNRLLPQALRRRNKLAQHDPSRPAPLRTIGTPACQAPSRALNSFRVICLRLSLATDENRTNLRRNRFRIGVNLNGFANSVQSHRQ